MNKKKKPTGLLWRILLMEETEQEREGCFVFITCYSL